MKLKTAKRIGALLQITLLISVGILIYCEKMNRLGLAIGLVVVMFGICMGLLFVSEQEDERPAKVKQRMFR